MSSATWRLFSFCLNVLTGPLGKISKKSELKSNIHSYMKIYLDLVIYLSYNMTDILSAPMRKKIVAAS